MASFPSDVLPSAMDFTRSTVTSSCSSQPIYVQHPLLSKTGGRLLQAFHMHHREVWAIPMMRICSPQLR